jgi:hypothetical protein
MRVGHTCHSSYVVFARVKPSSGLLSATRTSPFVRGFLVVGTMSRIQTANYGNIYAVPQESESGKLKQAA